MRLIINFIVLILFIFLLDGCVPPQYLKPEIKNISKENIATIVRDQGSNSILISIGGTPLPYNAWSEPDTYIKEGVYEVEYRPWVYVATRIGLKIIRITKKCTLKFEGGKIYYNKDIYKMLNKNGCETQIGRPYNY